MDHTEKNLNYAVVLGDWHFNSLGVVRSLGEAGVPVYFLNFSDFSYAENSKYTKHTYRVTTEDDVMQTLGTIAQAHSGKGVLFPCSDAAALMLDRMHEALQAHFIVPHAASHLEEYMEKDRMCRLACEAGFRVPDSLVVYEETLLSLAQKAYPVILKPLASVDGMKADIRICKTGAEAAETARSLFDAGYQRLLAQQFVASDDEKMTEYIGCKVKGEPVLLFGQLEKIREYPIHRGSTSFARLTEAITYIDPQALDRFLDGVGFEGLFDLEIKVADDKAWFIEINFRNGAPAYAYTAAGFNIPYAWFCKMTGLPCPEIGIRPLLLMSERDDLNHVTGKSISVFRWLKDVRQTDVFMVFNRQDSAPFRKAYNTLADLLVRVIGRKLR